jgi:DNA-binding transcriptional regulator LsrR (DeoR family)
MRQHNPMRNYRHFKREDADEVRRLYFSRQMTQKQLAAKFGLSQSAICRIVSNHTWAKTDAN